MNVRAPVLQLAAIVAVTSTACLKIESFQRRDAGGPDDITDGGEILGEGASALDDGNHIYVVLPDVYRMDFSSMGYFFPETFTIGTTPVLGPTQTGCNIEEGVGITYAPAAVFTSRDTTHLKLPDRQITRVLPGPGVAKVAIDWAAAFSKTTCAGGARGRTTFTFFPNGRITRFDDPEIDSNPDGSMCQCSGSSGTWEIGSYFTFDETKIESLTGVTRPSAAIGENQFPSAPICMASAGHALAMSWRAARGSRVRRITDTTLAAITDEIPVNSATTFVPLPDDSSTTLWASVDQGCIALTNLVAPYADDIQIQIDHDINMDPIGLGQDGMYGGEHSGSAKDGGWFIRGTPITLRTYNGNIPPFALWLNLENYPNIVSVSAPHTRQEITPKEWVFWFPNGLSGTDTIVINATP